VPHGRRLELTALGLDLRAPVSDALGQIERTISLRPTFDPASARRRYTVCGSDITILMLLAPLIRELERTAPGIGVDIVAGDPKSMGDRLMQGALDFSFASEPFVMPQLPCEAVLQDRYVCVVWTGNRRIRTSLSRQAYLSCGHVATAYGERQIPGAEQQAVADIHVQRRVEVTCASPALLGPLVVGTQRVATLPLRLAEAQARSLPLRILEPPGPLPSLRIFLQWSGNRQSDGALTWFRHFVIQVARDIASNDPLSIST
jgi:LysR family nod box-dependent transcriptional activator